MSNETLADALPAEQARTCGNCEHGKVRPNDLYMVTCMPNFPMWITVFSGQIMQYPMAMIFDATDCKVWKPKEQAK